MENSTKKLASLSDELKEYPPILLRKEVAEILRCSMSTVDNYVRNGIIDAKAMTRGYRVRKSDLIKYLSK